MAHATVRGRPGVAARRVGYAVAVLVNATLLLAVNGWPGWEAVPFLTAGQRWCSVWSTPRSSSASPRMRVYLLHDPPWLRALGDVVTTSVGLAALVRIWQVFPLDFGDSSFDWALVAHLLLGVAIVGSVIGVLVGLTSFVRDVTTHHPVTR